MKLYRYIVIAVCLLFVVSYAMAQEPAKENGIPPEFKDNRKAPAPPVTTKGEDIPVVDGKDTVDPSPAKPEPKKVGAKKVVKPAKVKKEKIEKREKYPDKPRDQR